MIRKVASRRYLEKLIVLIEDTSPLSSNYFDIVEYPTVLQAGKNLLRLRGSANLELNTYIYIEVLDSNGNPVFCDTLTTLGDDKSRTIAIWVYPETAPGPCTITIVGTARVDPNGIAYSELQKSTPNIRWSKKVGINSQQKNSSEIVFTKAPTISISELSRSLFTKTYSSGRFVTENVSGSISYSYYNGDTILSAPTNIFNADMVGGTVTISSSLFTNLISVPSITLKTPTFYTASIEKVISTRSVRVSNPYSVPSTQLGGSHTYRGGTVTTASIYYEASPVLTNVTQSSLVGSQIVTGSFALLTIEDMDPFAGDVNRVQVYLRKTSAPGVTKEFNGYDTPGNYIKVADTVVQSREVLVDASSPLIDLPLGIVSATTVASFVSSPSTTLATKHVSAAMVIENRSYPLINAISVKTASGIPTTLTTNEYFKITIAGNFNYQKDTVYNLSFDAVSEYLADLNPTLGYQLMDVVLSGSACTDSYLDETNVRYIGSLSNKNGGYFYENNSYDFTVPKTGTGQLVFLIRAGQWHLNNISIKPRQELGFTPNKLELLFPIEQYSNETYDIKVEYCDYLGNVSRTISQLKNFTFTPTPLRVNQLYADNVVVNNTMYASNVVVTGSMSTSGSNYLVGNTILSGTLAVAGQYPASAGSESVTITGNVGLAGYLRFNPVTSNINQSISASYIYVSGSTNDLYFSQNSVGYNNTTRLRWIEGNLYTGLLHGGRITSQSSTVYQISSGSGIIVNLNASLGTDPYPTIQYLQWSDLSASIAPLSTSYDQSFVSIDSTVNIFAQGTPYNDGDYNTKIPIGVVLHQNHSTINAVQTFPGVAYGWKQRSFDFIKAFGPLKLNGYILSPSGSSTGSLLLSGGTAWVDGRNYLVDPNTPSYIVEATGIATSKIYRYYQSGSNWGYDTNNGAGYATIDPTQYSNSGVLTPVPTNNWTIQRVYYFPNSATKALYVYYGNANYATEALALAAINTEAFTEAPNTTANAIFVGFMLLRHNANFTTSASYKIYQAGLFRAAGGGGGGSATPIITSLAGLSDVSISTPVYGDLLMYDNTYWYNTKQLTGSYTITGSLTISGSSTFRNIGPAQFTGSISQSGSYTVNTNVTPGLTINGINSGSSAAIVASGYNTRGGTAYFDFLAVTNTTGSVTNPNKFFRLDNTGNLQIIRSDYNQNIFQLSDIGNMYVNGLTAAGVSNNDGISGSLMFNNNNSQIYDDGNMHIHSRTSGQALWINTNGGALHLLAQSPLTGGASGSGVAIGSTTLTGYVTINNSKNYTTSAAYGYLTTAGAGTYPGGSQTLPISLYAVGRIWGSEIDAFSDERMKNIQGEIELSDAIKLINKLNPIKYIWKESEDKGLKVGYSAQQVFKAGFDHLIGVIPKEGLEETIDADGFVSPKDTQFSMNYDQIVPYHGVVLKHLLDKIEQLEKEIRELKK